ncbi:MAG: hypothetical protein NTY38_18065 [Acidobacteria bacterium]|nr:hypothetical protein [Acidobacteriota bacterium]
MTENRMVTGLLLALLSGTLHAAAVRPANLRCDFRTNPQGIDDRQPRLSWMLEPEDPLARGLKQVAYQVQAASRESGQADLWNSGKVNSDQSVHVVYGGKPLASGMRVFWKVRVWDQDGKLSDWSPVARWTMGLLESSDWKGQWIGLDQTELYRNPESPFVNLAGARWIWPQSGMELHTRFTLPAGAALLRAFAVAAGSGRYELSVNGRWVGVVNPGSLLPAFDMKSLSA